jgi:hypothetical protein
MILSGYSKYRSNFFSTRFLMDTNRCVDHSFIYVKIFNYCEVFVSLSFMQQGKTNQRMLFENPDTYLQETNNQD